MKKYLFSFGIIGLIGLVVGLIIYNKPHKDIKSSAADLQIEASQLLSQFEENESNANTKYLDKLIEVSGSIRETSTDEDGNINVILESENPLSGVICQLDNLTEHKNTSFKPGEKVAFKGLCTGMLIDVVLVRCVEVENK